MAKLQGKAKEFKENIIQKIFRKLFINEKTIYENFLNKKENKIYTKNL